MRSSGDAGGENELAKVSMSSRNLVVGIPREFLPSVMDSREMLATDFSSDSISEVVDAGVDMVVGWVWRWRESEVLV